MLPGRTTPDAMLTAAAAMWRAPGAQLGLGEGLRIFLFELLSLKRQTPRMPRFLNCDGEALGKVLKVVLEGTSVPPASLPEHHSSRHC